MLALLNSGIQWLASGADDCVSWLQTLVYVNVLQPLLFRFGLMNVDEDAFDALYWVIVGVLEVGVMYALLRPLEALMPAEKWQDRKGVGVDAVYTWITRLGILNLLFFFAMQPVFDRAQGWLRLHGVMSVDIDNLWPGVTTQPIVAFAIYLIVLDFFGYWYHRLSHRYGIWWELHAVHHSQRRMSFWCDNRNHLLDVLMQSCMFAAIALVIGVPPAQFVVLVALTNFVQNVQHANIRAHFGWLGERLIVSPRFHRRHHAIGYGHEGTTYGCNFGVLFPWWDMLFGSASFNRELEPTGIRDQLEGVRYGEGFWAQQGLAFGRIARRLGARGRNKAAARDDTSVA
ncbi:MAG: sterol desaturase family protein [Paraburkholderia tropica]|uniref:Sterol desaturase/sphingolipid hydroxylase (Fatty acid hydroxylase superfamily) n=1 Tax=Paraburkholderia tropica TaxID=92647 RepID=A0ABX5MLG0_9BURK|nr:sterol desaturase family protein [Paraburkholderia tropica]MDE1141469.1 sterol desaturase family protein [Paraburkholderia tropica]PXX13811.1 sterol desaturase/sphingolipid hydroxylase (fatty acid hydroxylase superfamily) [Paraburkholderia tropica]PZW77994.1 sterol desaturase/sphingolipid hydroxylase (fatty acid hydroxylase superfamily) [Paraburkholderia tropica]